MYRNYFQLHGLDPSGKSVVLPDEDDREHFINLLNLLCPDSNFMTGADGNVTSGLGTCFGPSATFPTSCSCLAAAINSPCIIEIKRARRSIGDIIKGIPARPTTVGNCCKDGKVTVYVSEFGGTVLGWPTIPGNYPPLPEPPPPFDDELPGSHPTKRLPDVPLPTPEFIVLAHELCGHAITGWQHPDDPTRYTCEDPVVKLENCVREEHSTPTCDYGVRNGHVW